MLVFLVQATNQSLFSQMLPASQIIDNFDDNTVTNWTIPAPACANTYAFTESNAELRVDFTINQPECYDKFYKQLPAATDFTSTPILSFKLKSQTTTFIKLQVELEDVFGNKTNSTPYIIYNPTIIPFDGNNPNGTYYEYAFDFSGDWNQVYPSATTVDKTKISKINFYVNGNSPPAGFYTGGSLYIDDLHRRSSSPLPTSAGTFYASGSFVNYSSSATTHIYRLTDDNGLFQSSTIFNKTAHDWTTNFDKYFNIYVGCYDQTGADGIAFFIMNDASKLKSTGGGGGGQGYGRGQRSYIQYPKSLAIEIDTWDNTGDGMTNDVAGATSNDHMGLNYDGFENNLVAGTRIDLGNMEDSKIHLMRVNYTASTHLLKVYLDGVLKLSTTYNIANYFNTGAAPLSTTAYWGFTGSTGGNMNEQWFSYNGTSTPPAYYTGCGTLPVKFVSFNGSLEQNQAKLIWQTTDEINNSYFEIQKTNNVDGEWESIGKVAAKGNSGISTYNFTDAEIGTGIWYYRLRQVDLDHTDSYSSVIQLSNTHQALASVYPNPAHDYIKVNAPGNKVDEIKISDLEGNIIYHSTNLTSDNDSFLISTSGMNTGCYFVHVNTNDTEMRSKVMIIK